MPIVCAKILSGSMSTPSTGRRSLGSEYADSWSRQPECAQGHAPVSICLHVCTQRLCHLQTAADQLRRRYPATSQSAVAGGGSSAIPSRSAVLDAGEGRQEGKR